MSHHGHHRSKSRHHHSRRVLKSVLDYDISSTRLGDGATSHVVVGTHRSTHRRAAVKIVDLRKSLASYQRELLSLSQIAPHESIVTLYGHFEDFVNEYGYLIIELIRSPTLDAFVSMKTDRLGLDEADALSIIQKVMIAVNHVHRSSVTHHDLKPENIFFDALFNRIRLVDFGLSQILDENDYVDMNSGSPLYMAPEVLHSKGTHNAVQSDVWSIGIIFYYLLVGDTPFSHAQSIQHLRDLVDTRNLYIPKFVSHESRELLALMLSYDPHDRPGIQQLLVAANNVSRSLSHVQKKTTSIANGLDQRVAEMIRA